MGQPRLPLVLVCAGNGEFLLPYHLPLTDPLVAEGFHVLGPKGREIAVRLNMLLRTVRSSKDSMLNVHHYIALVNAVRRARVGFNGMACAADVPYRCCLCAHLLCFRFVSKSVLWRRGCTCTCHWSDSCSGHEANTVVKARRHHPSKGRASKQQCRASVPHSVPNPPRSPRHGSFVKVMYVCHGGRLRVAVVLHCFPFCVK